jgi:uncharacterized protein
MAHTPAGRRLAVVIHFFLWNAAVAQLSSCPDYTTYSASPHGPYTNGTYGLPYQRPVPACRTLNSNVVEQTIQTFGTIIKDPDLFRLFENTFPNTLDTAIRWQGNAVDNTAEELAFIITGDIDAMWLRDSANQVQPYMPLLANVSSNDTLASLFRGTINLQARFINIFPWCNSYQAPVESGIQRQNRSAGFTVSPPFPPYDCFTPNFELDSFAALFQVSYAYYSATGDASFFGKFQWVDAVTQILEVAKVQMEPFYDANSGDPINQTYTFQSQTNTFTGTLGNSGLGNPVKYIGMVKSPFRPSDDTSIYQFLVPSNMQFARNLDLAATIMDELSTSSAAALASEMRNMSSSISSAIEKYAVVPSPDDTSKSIYAFEVDGYGGRNLMDDANIPSLLSAPLIKYLNSSSPNYQIYTNTRDFVLCLSNPWYSQGPVISGVGSSHTSVGKAWPMALITRILTSDDDQEIYAELKQLVSTTAGLGLMHESVNSRNQSDYTRPWFGWANGLFGKFARWCSVCSKYG